MSSIKEIEEKILDFWKEKDIFQKSIQQREQAPNFVFYEGPPTANGKPGIHHVLARSLKDLICRYRTMAGFKVLRKAGWDTHGIPVELEVEKELGFKTKQDIEQYGIGKFIEKCKENVWKYKTDWEKLTERMGYWVDLKNPYITYDNKYIETLWWIIKQIWDKGLFYQDYKVVPYCPRCGTTLSSHEVAQGYQIVKEPSVYLKFKLKNAGDFLLVWTTTPWTLPSNVAIAVNPDLDYVKAKSNGETLILAKNRTGIFPTNPEILEEFKGSRLLGLKYEPIFNFMESKTKTHFIIAADFVTAVDGTGLVHIAPAFGEDDMNVGKENNLPVLMTLDDEGKFIVGDWKGMGAKKADPLIIKSLEERKIIWKVENYEHEYPFCWRCQTPLLYRATTSWFINMKKVSEDLVKNNEEINWIPEHLKEGRFGEWLRGIKDWAFSRQRYWGTPLPIWECTSCKEKVVIASLAELEEKSLGKKNPLNNQGELDLHRPYVDAIKIKCPKCGALAERVPEVADVWFDSGSMPFAQYHYPFENQELQKYQYPADFIAEGIDQTRGWFYTLLAISTLLGKGASYKNVISHGLILDEKGKKMSKSLGNIVVPQTVIEKYGVDALRFYLLSSSVVEAEYLAFSDKGIDEVYKKIILLLSNINSFYQTYFAGKVIPTRAEITAKIASADPMDQWLIFRLNNITKETTKLLDKYEIVGATRYFRDFIDEFSTWYLKLSRDRFKKGDGGEYFGFALLELSKLIAPFMPFISEHIYQNLKSAAKKESVHLEDWPSPEGLMVNDVILKRMELTRKAVEIGLALRSSAGIKVRQPLNKIFLKDKETFDNAFMDLVKQELNVKEVILGNEDKLDTEISPELKEAGILRELNRQFSQLRKEEGLNIADKALAIYDTASQLLIDVIKNSKDELQEKSSFTDIKFESGLTGKELNIDGEKIKISLKK
ncbi:MAG TPA: isoleucine--tRNA ligase [Candidatus Paceibacterota bacterium]|nr:isoleucine--tRNA ligase [Candidatus Paceibacterota bacterium]